MSTLISISFRTIKTFYDMFLKSLWNDYVVIKKSDDVAVRR